MALASVLEAQGGDTVGGTVRGTVRGTERGTQRGTLRGIQRSAEVQKYTQRCRLSLTQRYTERNRQQKSTETARRQCHMCIIRFIRNEF